MFVSDKVYFFSLMLLPLLCSCVSYDVTDDVYVHSLNNKCYKTTKDLQIYEVRGSDKQNVSSLTSSYLMIGDSTEGQRFTKKNKVIGVIKKGNKLLIEKVVDFPYGSAGRCWVVKVNYDKYKGQLLEIPSCWVWEQPIWVSPSSPVEQKNSGKALTIIAKQLEGMNIEDCKRE